MKIAKVLVLVLGLFLIFTGTKAIMNVGNVGDAIKEAVVLDAPVVRPENEGRMVIVYGEPQMLSPVYDEELGLTLDTVKALRYSETYKNTSNKDGESKWDWVPGQTKTLVGEANVGEFALCEAILSTFTAEREYEDFDETEISRYALDYPVNSSLVYVLPKGAYYYSENTVNRDQNRILREEGREFAHSRAGTVAYRYRAFDMEKCQEMTFVGRQQGNMLMDSGVDGVAHVYTGVKTQEELVKGNQTSLMVTSGIGIACGVGLVVLAWRLGGKNEQQNIKRKKG